MSSVNEQLWFQQWSYKVIRDIEQCTHWGAKLIVLVAVKGTMDNYITMHEFPLLLQRLQDGMEKGKIKAGWSHIEERRIDVTRLSALATSEAQGDSYVVIASCPSQLMDEVQATVKGNRNVMASWATAGDISSLDQSVASISLDPVNTHTATDSSIYSTQYQETTRDICAYSSTRGDCSNKSLDTTHAYCRLHQCPQSGCSSSKSSQSKLCQLHLLEQQNQQLVAPTSVKTQPVTTSTLSLLFEGGADGAIENFKRVFGKPPEDFVDKDNDWYLAISTCATIAKQNAVARMLATDATVKDWNGILHLRTNNIGDEGAKFIGEGVKHSKTLKKLYLSNNSIGDQGAKFIGEGVKHSKSLKELFLDHNHLTDAGEEQLRQVCEARNIHVSL